MGGGCIVARTLTARFTIGVDLGGTKLLAGAVAPDLSVHHRALRPAWGLDQGSLVESCVQAVEEAAEAVGGDVAAVGFGIPCLIDQRTGTAVMAVHLPLHDIPFRDVMAERLGLPVLVDNDANCAALVEARAGAGRGATELVMLTLGTGIGGGIVVGGEVYRGALGAAGELGHMVIDLDGPPCHGFCPNRGCLEALASGSALVREASLAVAARPDTPLGRALEDGQPLSGPLITELAHDGDPVSRDVIALIGRRLGVGIANVVNVLNPEIVVIGGGVIAAGEMLLAPAREEMLARALSPSKELVRVEAAAFGAESGMVGASLMAREAVAA
jgi:glucokinase